MLTLVKVKQSLLDILALVAIIALHCPVAHLWVIVGAFINIHYCLCEDMGGGMECNYYKTDKLFRRRSCIHYLGNKW